MRFLALSPLAATLLAVLATAALVAMYFLKLRHRRMVISSSMLWSRVLDRREARSLWEKLRWILSIVLAVLIALLMVFAVARPEVDSLSGAGRPTMIVLDTSPSMLARMGDGRTRWQHAADLARSIVQSRGSGAEFRIADTSGQFDSPFTSDISQVRQLINRMQPVAAPSRFPELEGTEALTYFISDGVAIPPLPKTTTKLLVYDPARNVGITAFEVRSMPSTPLLYEAYLEVTNFSRDARKATINIAEGGPGRITRESQIPPGESFSTILDLSKFEGGGIRATIQSDGDAFSADDVAYSYLPLKKKTKTRLVTKGNPYLQTALKLDSFVDLSVIDPKDYREDPAVDSYIFDDFAPAEQPSKPALIVGAQNVPWLKRPTGTVEKPAFTTWLEDHPVMQYLSLHDVSIAKASAIDGANLTVLASSGQNPVVPLIVASPPGAAGARWIMTTFDLQSSDFPVHESFPLFVDNALAWFGRDRLALRGTIGTVEVPIVGTQIYGPDGKPVVSHGYLDRTIFEAPVAGLYVAAKDGMRQYIAVNLMSRRYSSINHGALSWDSESKLPSRYFRREPWFYLLLLAVILLGLEWFTYHRRITL
ncbi:MAG TPA: VWA domain-containing protein [Terriglobia bacterium]|nr:VWA domain-containing protein [Terriglobia bacterium]